MLSFDNEINPQTSSPLFNRLPAEIRNEIFSLASTTTYDKNVSYPKNAYHYRPNFRHKRYIPSSLPLTCRLVYLESHSLLATHNTYIKWCNRGLSDSPAHPSMTSAQLFMQQVCLESWDHIALRLSRSFDTLRELTITIRHSDWWSWEHSAPLGLDPKFEGTVYKGCYSKSTDPFAEGSWGMSFVHFRDLTRFVLELETREGKKGELDAIVAKADGWRFPLAEGKELVLDESKTKRTGWVGKKLRKALLS